MRKVATPETERPAPPIEGMQTLCEVDKDYVTWVQLLESLRSTDQLSRLARVLATEC